MRQHLTPAKKAIIKKIHKQQMLERGWREGNPPGLLVAIKIDTATMENSMVVLVAQSRPTLFDPMDCGPPGSFVHGIFQARKSWSGLPFPSPEDLPDPGIEAGSPVL